MEKFIRWPQMAAVLEILKQTFEQNKYTDKVLEAEFKKNRHWGAKDRRHIAEAAYDMLRWWRRLHYYLDWDWQRDKSNKDYWLLALVWIKWRGFHFPQWDIVKDSKGILDISFLEKDKVMGEEDRHSLPQDLYVLGLSELGEKWSQLLSALNEQAPVYLRTNSLKNTPQQLQESLAQEEVNCEWIKGTEAIKLNERKNVFITQNFKDGKFEVQDLGSQKIAQFVAPQARERIVDACAGAGGKSLHLASLMDNKGKVIAMDIHAWKLTELRKRARRAGVDIIECRHIDNLKVIKRMHNQADKLLLDVPCSGLGVLKRNPDAKWKLTPKRVGELRLIQQNLLRDYSLMVKPKGELIYSTCSVLPSENERQIRHFMDLHRDQWELIDERILDPQVNGQDGFYMAKLVRKA